MHQRIERDRVTHAPGAGSRGAAADYDRAVGILRSRIQIQRVQSETRYAADPRLRHNINRIAAHVYHRRGGDPYVGKKIAVATRNLRAMHGIPEVHLPQRTSPAIGVEGVHRIVLRRNINYVMSAISGNCNIL